MTKKRAPDPRKVGSSPDAEEAPPSPSPVTIVGFIGDQDYPLRVLSLSAVDAGALRVAQAGATIREIVSAIVENRVDLDTVAQVVWLSRRQQGDSVPYSLVARSVTLDSKSYVRFATDEEMVSYDAAEVDSPET